MSEPVKKIKPAPESYSPKNKPEILRMAEESAGKTEMKKEYQIKTANGGSYIDGVPKLKWGEYKDCTYSGAVSLLLQVLGLNATYEQIAGLTGSCYRFGMCYGWDPGSLIVNTDFAYLGFGDACGTDYNANRVYGLDFYGIADAEERDQKVQHSIDNGIPVLCMGGFGAPEWCLLTGYEKTADGIKYFGRSYFDDNATEEELLTDNKYSFFKGYPGEWPDGFLKLCDRSCEPTNPLDALKTSLETCIKMFSPHEKMGYGAYEFAISSLKNNKYPSGEDENAEYNGWNVSMLFSTLSDARRAAYVYLENSAKLLSGENKPKLLSVSAMYREMFDILSTVLPYKALNDGEYNSGLPAELREQIIDALQKMVELERQARVVVQNILDRWSK